MIELNAERARRTIVEHTERLAASAVLAGPDAAVPTAPEWSVTDLVEHVGRTQHWVAEIIERRITDPAQLPTELAVLPADPREWPTWLSESARRAANACSDDALDAPVFNAAGDERPGALFWMSSLLNEAVVHGFDAAAAADTAREADRLTDIDADIAAALIGNHFTMLASPTWKLQRPESATAISGSGQTLQWLATDMPGDAGAWFVERHADGARWQPRIQPADVTVTGPARSLLLTLTRRLPLTGHDITGITVEGDTALARHWIDNTAHASG
ncbi:MULTISPECIES: maleylpyruvate isomerase N-terminal domain-containing protein [unclassified Kitasatospora]|uniref:maleylpyruvate isomerase N-terminal domain-containing protein n=1 Tax=unclassified Kitasatospora TaxID=2633591 RepID=UPI0033DCC936